MSFHTNHPIPPAPGAHHVLLIDDHAAIIEMMTQVVESLPGFRVVGTALEGRAALKLCREQRVDVIVLDLVLPEVPGLTLLGELMALCPGVKVLIFTGNLNPVAMRGALGAGVLGVVEKMASLDTFRAALQSVAIGQTYYGPLAGELIKGLVSRKDVQKSGAVALSEREKMVLCHVAQGLSSREIAAKYGLSVHTVINHRSNLMRKTGLRRVAQLSLFAAQSGLIDDVLRR